MAMATARYVLPVPAGPMPNTISYFSMASRYRRWLTLFGCTVRRPNERCRPASANPRKVALGSAISTRNMLFRSPLLKVNPERCS